MRLYLAQAQKPIERQTSDTMCITEVLSLHWLFAQLHSGCPSNIVSSSSSSSVNHGLYNQGIDLKVTLHPPSQT